MLRLTADDFDVKTLYAGTIDLWLMRDDGEWIAATGGEPLIVDYENCFYQLVFSADFSGAPLPSLPQNLVVTGRGATSPQDEYDFVAVAAAEPDPDIFVDPCEDETDPPPSDPVCEWVTQPCASLPVNCIWANFVNVVIGRSASVMGLWVTCTTVSGSGYAEINAHIATLGGSLSVSSSCAKTNGGSMTVFLSGEDCCQTCSIHVVANPSITGSAKINPSASASIAGSISVGVQGTGASASGSANITEDGGSYEINGVPYPIAGGAQTASFAANAQPPLDQTFQTCNISVTFSTAGSIDCTATAMFYNWYAKGSCQFGTATPGLTIDPQTQDCPDVEPIEPIVIGLGP